LTGQPPRLPQDQQPRRPPVAGLLFILLLVLGGLYLVHVLRDSARLQDCVMAGRTNCAPIDATAGGG
jgi:hypothetical protein